MRESPPVSLEISQVIRIKGSIDQALAATDNAGTGSARALTEAYQRFRLLCEGLVAGTEAEAEFGIAIPSPTRGLRLGP